MMPPDNDSDLRRRLEAYFDGRLTPEETEELGRRLREDPEARRHYWDEAHWHSALSVWGEQALGQKELQTEAAPCSECSQPDAEIRPEMGSDPASVGAPPEAASAPAFEPARAAEPGTQFEPVSVPARNPLRWWLPALAFAACLAFVFMLARRPASRGSAEEATFGGAATSGSIAAVQQPGTPKDATLPSAMPDSGAAHAGATLARLTYAADVVWSAASPVRDGSLDAGNYELERGIVRFETTAGAVVTVAAPARFRFVTADRIELSQGRITARMLREEANITVRVADMEVRDLGTAFGIDANDGSRTLVSVFDGAVAVTDAVHKGTAKQVVEGQSLIGRHQGGTVFESAAYSAEAFRDLWPLTVGINDASRLVEFLPPGPLLKPLRSYRANDRLYLFPEQQNVSTSRHLPIDLSAEVRSWPESQVSPYPLPPGVRVNSYLVFFQPEPAMHGVRRLNGSITFQQKIIAVMCSDQGLTESDAMLGDSKADYSTRGRRGLEELDKVNLKSTKLPHDSIRIGPDGRTIHFDFYVIDEREQMRVIVAAD